MKEYSCLILIDNNSIDNTNEYYLKGKMISNDYCFNRLIAYCDNELEALELLSAFRSSTFIDLRKEIYEYKLKEV